MKPIWLGSFYKGYNLMQLAHGIKNKGVCVRVAKIGEALYS